MTEDDTFQDKALIDLTGVEAFYDKCCGMRLAFNKIEQENIWGNKLGKVAWAFDRLDEAWEDCIDDCWEKMREKVND